MSAMVVVWLLFATVLSVVQLLFLHRKFAAEARANPDAPLGALTGDQSFVAESVAGYRQRRDAVLARINAIPGLICTPPGGVFYLYANCAGLVGKTMPDGKKSCDGGMDFLLEFSEACRRGRGVSAGHR